MEYLIATVVIMLFCITALIQDKSPESTMPVSRHKAKSLKPGKSHEKSVTKFTGVEKGIPAFPFPWSVESNTTEIRFKQQLLPKLPGTAHYGLIPVMANSQGYFYQAPVYIITKQAYYFLIIGSLISFNEHLLSYLWKPDVKCSSARLSKNK